LSATTWNPAGPIGALVVVGEGGVVVLGGIVAVLSLMEVELETRLELDVETLEEEICVEEERKGMHFLDRTLFRLPKQNYWRLSVLIIDWAEIKRCASYVRSLRRHFARRPESFVDPRKISANPGPHYEMARFW
jgi:hypothetical protein